MLSLFQRKRASLAAASPPTPATHPSKGLLRPESAASLLATPRRQKLLEHIWQRTSLSRKQFAALYRTPLERYAELVQQFPASESHHHAYPGGMRWSSSSPPPKATTTPTPAECWTTA